MHKVAIIVIGITAALLSSSGAQAQWGQRTSDGWGSGWDNSRWNDPGINFRTPTRNLSDSREEQVEVTRFVSPDPEARILGHGYVSIESETGEGALITANVRRAYEAAIVDALIGVGYDTTHSDAPQQQITKLKISRQTLSPAEEKRNPISGTTVMQVGTYGQSYGLGVNIDLSKPRSALITTRLDVQIIAKDSQKVLWEGYASIATRENDAKWADGLIAIKLANALFDEFPKAESIIETSG